MSSEFNITLDDRSYKAVSLEEIVLIKDNPSLLVKVDDKLLEYDEFRKLAIVRKIISKVEDEEKVEDNRDYKTDIVKTVQRATSHINNSATMAGEKFSLQTALKLINAFEGDQNSVRDFINSIKYYAKCLETIPPNSGLTEQKKLIEFLLNIKLKGRARQVFICEPVTIDQLCDKLLKRFKPRETLVALQGKLDSVQQEGLDVDSYAKIVEEISYKMLQIHMVDKDASAEETVRSMNESIVLGAFTKGLRKEFKDAVVAARVTTVSDAIDVAQEAESAHKNDKRDENVFAVETSA